MELYNNKKNLFYKLKKSSISTWKKYTEHSFVKELGDGTLSSSVFKEYLIQDYIFLQRFIKILALSAYKAKTIEDMNRSVNFIMAIKNELKLHVHYCKKFGISKNKILKAKERKENKDYTNYVMKIGLKKSNLELFIALSAYKAKSVEDMNRSVDFIIAIKNELKLHVHYCKKFGISKNKIFKAKERKENKDYTNYVMKIGLKKSNLELFIALSPCVIGYGEIGYNLKKNKNFKKNKYSSWIKMYSSKEYQSVAKDNIAYLDHLYRINNKKNINSLTKIFKKASNLEANFWQMAYK